VDTKLADAGTFVILKEDHTLGNILRMSLLRDRRVLFGGYRMPHPLENKMNVKIKTRPQTTPIEVLQDSIENLQVELRSMQEQVMKQVEEKKSHRASQLDLL